LLSVETLLSSREYITDSMARWNRGLTMSCQNVENNQVGLEKTSNGGLTTDLNISQQANTSELKPIFIMKRKLFLKCNVASPSTTIEAMVLSFDYFQVLSCCKDNSYTLDFFRQILWFFQPKKLGNLHSFSVNLSNFSSFWETIAKCLISPN
jgi:hypothetical protein